MGQYGIPYMGSKSSIAEELIKRIPSAEHFYDLFGGGFSITHAMLKKRKHHFKEFHFNEPRPGICQLIQDAIEGKYNYDRFRPPFVDRETFFKNIHDPYIKMIWSFGNNGKGYLFSKEIEPYKRSMHNAIIFNSFDELTKKVLKMDRFKEGYSIKEKRFFLRNKIAVYMTTGIPDFLLPFLSEKQLQQLERIEKLQHLQQLERLTFYCNSYDQVPIKDNSIIYCDPPYFGTAEYDLKFDHQKFYQWADKNENPVFISEYFMPKEFVKIFSIKKRSLFDNSKETTFKTENLYVNKAGMKLIRKLNSNA